METRERGLGGLASEGPGRPFTKLNARLTVNGRSVGSCYDNVGTIGARKVRYASCTVRTGSLVRMWNNHLDGAGFRYVARTHVSYRYYR
ncbi:hypothetical protein [Nonomuraea candida]|uniref:hypothetical protein n=1 Tax=Nonomuraea candida TaxID=359159 RepID=UPI0005BA9A96|nr:hypothetical protein [Nonomuraea candida]